ncbi:hypothetical protein LX97_03399 [Nonlabens dokdonensis]|uniref:Lacal_2735 family protein n=2 Tax=Nonlabens dokdonensis TaxID=328515 RepID=L7WDB8_NONDD|nr:Lacal_2735 family protein [Nonlabens dokdonensis]AGC77926.1 hypothetical protein DDD_2799 [Nonlabens dokdonensis DSW-6]PZX36642.1 hypothetical protein LX97_03399 [Nonlabens dokdonensis]
MLTMQKNPDTFHTDLTQLERLEKRYCSLMKQSFEAALKDRDYSDALNDKALEIKEDIDLIRSKICSD